MKDNSKAQWPDGMKWCSPNAIILDDETEVVYLPSEDLAGKNSDIAEIINRHRFGQINALPRMVVLLKRLSELDSYSECVAEAKSILAQIGEEE